MEYKKITLPAVKSIALVAHDNKKKDLVAWCKKHQTDLAVHKLYATGTTGLIIEKETGLPINKLISGPLGGDQQVGLADAGWAEEDDVLLAFNEAERGQALDLLALQGRLEAEVEVGECLHSRQPTAPHRGLEAPIVPKRDLRAEDGGDRISGSEAAVDAREYGVECFERSGHLQIGELSSDLLA